MSSSDDRLDRIEQILDRLVTREDSENKRIISIERTVQAMLEQRVTDRFEHEERMAKLEQNLAELREVSAKLTNVQAGMARWLTNIDDTQPTILKRLMSIENKIDTLLESDN